MNSDEIIKRVKENFATAVLETNTEIKQPYLIIEKDKIHDVIEFAKNDEKLKFDFLRSLSGVDTENSFFLVYHLYSYPLKQEIVIKCKISRDDPKIDTVSDIYGAADWHERETFDLFGIIFNNHKDLKRILLPPDWVGHPLRKDYKEPKEYRGITHKRENKI